MKPHILYCLLLIISLQTGFCQQKQWESAKAFRITNVRLQDAIKNTNLSATNFDNDGIADFVSTGRDLIGGWADSLWYLKVTPSINLQPEIVNCLDYEKILPLSYRNFDIEDSDLIFLGFADQPLKANHESPYNDAIIGIQNNGRIIGIIVATFPSQGEATFEFYDAASPYIYLSSGDYDDDGLSEFLIYDQESRKLQLWEY